MSISIDKLIEEKTLLQKDFDELNKKVKDKKLQDPFIKEINKRKIIANIRLFRSISP